MRKINRLPNDPEEARRILGQEEVSYEGPGTILKELDALLDGKGPRP